MGDHEYFAERTRDEEELRRLRLHETYFNAKTFHQLEMLGVTLGWDCLEVGAGNGSVAEWLAQKVGLNGKVVATDINIRFLRFLNVPNLEIRHHDIIKDELESDRYNLAHCRNTLLHIPEPEKAIEKMAKAIRPGGWLFLEDVDYGTEAADTSHPEAEYFNKVLKEQLDAVKKEKMLDPYFGRKLRGFIEKLGFNDVGCEGTIDIVRGGENAALAREMTRRGWADPMIAAGLCTREQVENGLRFYRDPSFYRMGSAQIRVWGRKPL
jgi:2-polyprenyl-3-methyl-5-hydroxy-6-metoxy-1,4-benzoquinol methylase